MASDPHARWCRRAGAVAALAGVLALAGCADADGSKPRLASGAPATAAGFNGGYAGTNYGFSNLNTKSVPF